MTSRPLSRFRESLLGLTRAGKISVMPDYFVDRFVRVESLETLLDAIRKKAVEGGGSIRGTRQSETKGGNGVNLAYSLAKFGTDVNLIAIADSLSARTLLATFQQFKNAKVDIIRGFPGYTVAFEFVEGERHFNVMASDVGDLDRFDGSSISQESWRRIEQSKIVCVVNWSANKSGTELCELVFSRARKSGARTFFDPADVSGMGERLKKARSAIFEPGLVDIVSINEIEARVFCSSLSNYSLPRDYSAADLKKAALVISDTCNCIVDLHTHLASVTSSGRDCELMECRKVEQRIVTGAGDVWDSGDLIGHLLGWGPGDRLNFANTAAGLYVSKDNAEPPSIDEVLKAW